MIKQDYASSIQLLDFEPSPRVYRHTHTSSTLWRTIPLMRFLMIWMNPFKIPNPYASEWKSWDGKNNWRKESQRLESYDLPVTVIREVQRMSMPNITLPLHWQTPFSSAHLYIPAQRCKSRECDSLCEQHSHILLDTNTSEGWKWEIASFIYVLFCLKHLLCNIGILSFPWWNPCCHINKHP